MFLNGSILEIGEVERLESFAAFEDFLARPGPWIGGFDFPFSLPRELVRDLGWPQDWQALVAHCAGMTRLELRAALDAVSQLAPTRANSPSRHRPPGGLLQPDEAGQSSGRAHVPRRRAASPLRCAYARLGAGHTFKVALEAYPGLLVRKQLGIRASYKSDTRSEHTAAGLGQEKNPSGLAGG